MKINIRQETPSDYGVVSQIIEAAFRDDPHGDHTEHHLVERLRKSDEFIPELSLVAEVDGEIVGHILLTKIKIKNKQATFHSLALAPVSVKPSFQKKGIGAELIRAAHRKAKELGHQSIVLVGHENYYPKFGYELTSKYGIELPFEAPDENCMVIELEDGALQGVSGMVEYSQVFF